MPAAFRRSALPDRLLVVTVACAAVAVCLFAGGHVEALKAAGLTGGSAILTTRMGRRVRPPEPASDAHRHPRDAPAEAKNTY